MLPHKLTLCLLVLLFIPITAFAQRKPPTGGRLAVVVDERLAALRATPELTGKLVRRLSRGRMVAIRATKTAPDGVTFFLVNVTRRTLWLDSTRSPCLAFTIGRRSKASGPNQPITRLRQTLPRGDLSGSLSPFGSSSHSSSVTRR